ncbi:MAG TPA: hypothetical protein PK680_01845 [Novosphingobium sp.]|nr:hypothetical protein [Novosphingobium sp.]
MATSLEIMADTQRHAVFGVPRWAGGLLFGLLAFHVSTAAVVYLTELGSEPFRTNPDLQFSANPKNVYWFNLEVAFLQVLVSLITAALVMLIGDARKRLGWGLLLCGALQLTAAILAFVQKSQTGSCCVDPLSNALWFLELGKFGGAFAIAAGMLAAGWRLVRMVPPLREPSAMTPP